MFGVGAPTKSGGSSCCLRIESCTFGQVGNQEVTQHQRPSAAAVARAAGWRGRRVSRPRAASAVSARSSIREMTSSNGAGARGGGSSGGGGATKPITSTEWDLRVKQCEVPKGDLNEVTALLLSTVMPDTWVTRGIRTGYLFVRVDCWHYCCNAVCRRL